MQNRERIAVIIALTAVFNYKSHVFIKPFCDRILLVYIYFFGIIVFCGCFYERFANSLSDKIWRNKQRFYVIVLDSAIFISLSIF